MFRRKHGIAYAVASQPNFCQQFQALYSLEFLNVLPKLGYSTGCLLFLYSILLRICDLTSCLSWRL